MEIKTQRQHSHAVDDHRFPYESEQFRNGENKDIAGRFYGHLLFIGKISGTFPNTNNAFRWLHDRFSAAKYKLAESCVIFRLSPLTVSKERKKVKLAIYAAVSVKKSTR